MKNKLVALLILLLSLSLGFPINAAQNNDPQETNGTAQDKQSNEAKLRADRVQYNKKENIRIASGNVRLDYKDNNVTSNHLKMYNKKNILIFTEDVKLKRPQETITSDKIQLNLDQDQLVAEKNVVLDTSKNDKKLHLTSEYLKLWLDNDEMLARKNVHMDYDGQEIRGEALEYNAADEEMIITNQAEIKEDEEWIQSDRIVVNLETGSIDAKGQVKMQFEVKEE